MDIVPKSEKLYQHIKRDILALALKPGSALRLPALSERYGVGQTPLRDCLNRLSKDYLVETEHNKGFRVTALSMEDLTDLEKARSVIEGALFAESCQLGGEDWEASVVGTFHNLKKVPLPSVLQDLDEMDAWITRHAAFHNALISAAQHTWLNRFSNSIGEQLERYHRFIFEGIRDHWHRHPEQAEPAASIFAQSMELRPHAVLYDAALGRDPAIAKQAFLTHSQMSAGSYQKIVDLLATSDFFSRRA